MPHFIMIEAGQVLQGRYALHHRLGRTAAGHATWLAVDTQIREAVTVKLLAFSPQMAWEELRLFEREAQVLKSLAHPHIPRYRDYFDLDKSIGAGMPWFALVQDYIPGDSLQELLGRGYHFSEKQVRQIATQVLEILVYLHQLSPPVLHRDIKPSNLILGEDNQIYLIDFGAVQAQAAVTGVTFTVVGTSGYAPLEQFWGRAVPASDLYALGSTLIHVLTGVTPAELPQKDGRIQFQSHTIAKPDLIAWIETATEISLEKRFPSAVTALEALTSGHFQPRRPARLIGVRKSPKPEGTLIKLGTEGNKLKIKIPAPGLRKVLQSGAFGVIAWLYLSMVLTMVVVVLLTTGLSSGFVGYLLIALGISGYMLKFFGERTELTLHPNFLSFRQQTWFIRYGRSMGSVKDILSVFLIQKGLIYQVRLKTDDCTYNLGGALGEPEAVWLVDEIRAWLQQHQLEE